MKQPAALLPLSLTEMWERFGLYLVQGLLIFYMTKFLDFSDARSYIVMGQFTALVYVSPIAGGLCADRLLGFRHTILLGAVLLFIGYVTLALSTLTIFPKEASLFLGLAIIILGNGFLKPNISSFLGEFYQADDPLRDSGFTIYYMVFNLGIALSTLSSGYIQRNYGWFVCFLVASFGLILSIIFFLWGYRYFGDKGLSVKRWVNKSGFILTIIVGGIACYSILRLANFGNLILTLVGGLILIMLGVIISQLEPHQRKKMLALLILILISIIFWALFFQIFLVANLFIDRNVDRVIMGNSIPPVAFISLESIFIFILSPLFAMCWQRIYKANLKISRGLQFTLAMIAIGIGMQLIVMGIHFHNSEGLVNPLWIVVSYMMITVGELLLSPIGLSMVTQFAPQKLVGLMMGVWFLGLSYGGLLAGYLGKQASISAEWIHFPEHTNPIYAHAFQTYVWLALAAALVTLLLTPWLNRLTRQHV